jgi:hypothetical protein
MDTVWRADRGGAVDADLQRHVVSDRLAVVVADLDGLVVSDRLGLVDVHVLRAVVLHVERR